MTIRSAVLVASALPAAEVGRQNGQTVYELQGRTQQGREVSVHITGDGRIAKRESEHARDHRPGMELPRLLDVLLGLGAAAYFLGFFVAIEMTLRKLFY